MSVSSENAFNEFFYCGAQPLTAHRL